MKKVRYIQRLLLWIVSSFPKRVWRAIASWALGSSLSRLGCFGCFHSRLRLESSLAVKAGVWWEEKRLQFGAQVVFRNRRLPCWHGSSSGPPDNCLRTAHRGPTIAMLLKKNKQTNKQQWTAVGHRAHQIGHLSDHTEGVHEPWTPKAHPLLPRIDAVRRPQQNGVH